MTCLRRRVTVACVLAVVVIAGAPDAARANGKGWPMVAYPKTPAIPMQRALIVWRDGVETLVVESTMETDSPEVGWVLPLPAEPDKLQVADPGLLKSMSYSQRPEIRTAVSGSTGWPVFIAILVFLVAAFVVDLEVRGPALWGRVVLYVPLVLLFGWAISAPSLTEIMGGAGGPPVPGIAVSSTQRVGSYETTVLRADNSDALDQWLKGQGLTGLDEADRRVADDYIARKWCFVVSRFSKDDKTTTPHPIMATFRTETPVYPMKFTALAGGETRVELYVIADKQAHAESFACQGADKYTSHLANNEHPQRMAKYESASTGLVVGHPGAVALMRDDCVVTALAATLSPEEMTRDVELSFAAVEPFRPHFYTEEARADVFVRIMAYGAIIVLPILGFIYRGRRRRQWTVHIASLCLVAAVLVTGWIACLDMETIPVQMSRGTSHWAIQGRLDAFRKVFQYEWQEARKAGQVPDLLTPEQTEKVMATVLSEASGMGELVNNPFTGEPMTRERSPGNYWFVYTKEGARMCIYDGDGTEHRAEIDYEVYDVADTDGD